MSPKQYGDYLSGKYQEDSNVERLDYSIEVGDKGSDFRMTFIRISEAS